MNHPLMIDHVGTLFVTPVRHGLLSSDHQITTVCFSKCSPVGHHFDMFLGIKFGVCESGVELPNLSIKISLDLKIAFQEQ